MPRTADPKVRAALIEAAAELLADEGEDRFSLRKVAAAVGTSTMAVYTHFGSRDELILAVADEAFLRLRDDLAAAVGGEDPIEDLRRLGQAYRQNAISNPHLYRVMFGPGPHHLPGEDTYVDVLASRTPPPGMSGYGIQAFEVVERAVQRAIDAGHLEAPRDLAPFTLWSAVHGAVSLELSGMIGPADPVIFDRMVDLMIGRSDATVSA